MAKHFDASHKAPDFTDSVYIRLVGKEGKGYRLPGSSKLSPVLRGLFKIKRKVNNLAYKLELPDSMHIHPIISVVHLEEHVPDDWNWVLPDRPGPVLVDGEEQYEIDKIVRQLTDSCLVCWRGLDEETWEPTTQLQEDVPELLRQFQKQEWGKRATRKDR